tara:strand:- start:199 stop:549 length:351 start_codon:yes stop_codon:yes gene_type:complete
MAFKQPGYSPYTKMSKKWTKRDAKKANKMMDSIHGSGAKKYWDKRAKQFAASQNYAASVTPWIKTQDQGELDTKALKEKIKRLTSSIKTEKDWKVREELKKSLNILKDKLYGSDRG